MEIKTKTTIDMTFPKDEMKILEDACALFNEIEEDLRKYRDEKIDITFNDTSYSYEDFYRMSILLCDMIDELDR